MSHQHIKIYEHVPFNSGKSKLPDLEPYDPSLGMAALALSFDPSKRRNDLLGPNTAQREIYMKRGFISERYDDEPYIVPFIAPSSDKAVLIVPGGAYQDVSLDQEGYPTAEYLQQHGVSAFVLKYRVYPYKYPAAALDCRRALCYLKAHAKEFGFDPKKLSLLGFSAGGNLVGVTTYLFRSLPDIEGYIKDEIDEINPLPATLAPIYPELSGEKFLLSLQFGERLLKDEEYAKKICAEQYIPQYVDASSPPVFLCCAIDDGVVDPINCLNMAKACHDAKIPYEVHMFAEGGHGFGSSQEDFPPMFGLPARRMDGTKEWINLYITFLEKMMTRKTQ